MWTALRRRANRASSPRFPLNLALGHVLIRPRSVAAIRNEVPTVGSCHLCVSLRVLVLVVFQVPNRRIPVPGTPDWRRLGQLASSTTQVPTCCEPAHWGVKARVTVKPRLNLASRHSNVRICAMLLLKPNCECLITNGGILAAVPQLGEHGRQLPCPGESVLLCCRWSGTNATADSTSQKTMIAIRGIQVPRLFPILPVGSQWSARQPGRPGT